MEEKKKKKKRKNQAFVNGELFPCFLFSVPGCSVYFAFFVENAENAHNFDNSYNSDKVTEAADD